jgi:hypothetical protein
MPEVYNKHRKHPEGAIWCGRPGLFGNPFTAAEYGQGEAVRLHREWIKRPEQKYIRDKAREVLRGRDLLCVCKPRPCHCDVLLEIANGPDE